MWTDALTDERVAEAKTVYQALERIGWNGLSRNDRNILQVLGYLTLERDDISLERLCEADIGELHADDEGDD
jgi:hypothetical protein